MSYKVLQRFLQGFTKSYKALQDFTRFCVVSQWEYQMMESPPHCGNFTWFGYIAVRPEEQSATCAATIRWRIGVSPSVLWSATPGDTAPTSQSLLRTLRNPGERSATCAATKQVYLGIPSLLWSATPGDTAPTSQSLLRTLRTRENDPPRAQPAAGELGYPQCVVIRNSRGHCPNSPFAFKNFAHPQYEERNSILLILKNVGRCCICVSEVSAHPVATFSDDCLQTFQNCEHILDVT